MTLPSKQRRKKPAAVLDWRELAQGPALRGLAEVLATPPELAKERACQRITQFGVEPPTEGVAPTVGDTSDIPTVVASLTDCIQAPSAFDLPTIGDTPTVGATKSPHSETPTVGVSFASTSPESYWMNADGRQYESHRVRRVTIAQHSMTLGEERVYQALWHAKENDGVFWDGKKAKTFSLGYDRIAKLVRLNEKSVRTVIPKLIAKKILEVIASENSAARTGRTYRIFSYEEILERQRADTLLYVVRNGWAVEFVQPVVAPSVNHIVAPTVGVTPTDTVGVTPTDTVGVTPTDTVGVTPTPLYTLLVRESHAAPSSSSITEALSVYGSPDDDAVRHLITQCRKNAPDAEYDEIAYFIHDKGQVIRKGKISNPIAFLLVYVPKCFLGESLIEFRKKRQQAKEAEDARQRELGDWYQKELEKQQAALQDPNASEEEKRWARKFLE